MIIGIPPAIAASYKTTLLYSSAILNNSSPRLARSSLFAVTICFPFFIAVVISSNAGSIPPTSSATISSPSMSRFLLTLRTAILVTSTLSKDFKVLNTPEPTVPSPINPILIFFSILKS